MRRGVVKRLIFVVESVSYNRVTSTVQTTRFLAEGWVLEGRGFLLPQGYICESCLGIGHHLR